VRGGKVRRGGSWRFCPDAAGVREKGKVGFGVGGATWRRAGRGLVRAQRGRRHAGDAGAEQGTERKGG
jgi:hypothetical protein